MKSKLILLSLLMLLTIVTNYAQSSAEQAGIAVQGIARDANNTALASQSISLTFELYYLNSSNLETSIFSETLNIQTDAFGIFSHVINPGAVNNSKFANNQSYLRIKKGTEIISNETLNHVPYAISANNGVPTGSIMPFIGTDAPYGWAICDGTALPTTATALIALVGNNAPDLRGMFLRGSGTSPVNGEDGPALKATQQDGFQSHLHADGTLATNTTGNHTHTTSVPNEQEGALAVRNDEAEYYEWNKKGNTTSSSDGNHSHDVTGSTAYTGTNETRPVNYGVNYIIKL